MLTLILELGSEAIVDLEDAEESNLMEAVIDAIIQRDDSQLLDTIDEFIDDRVQEIEDADNIEISNETRQKLWDEIYNKIENIRDQLIPHVTPHLPIISPDSWCHQIKPMGNVSAITFLEGDDLDFADYPSFDDDVPF
jgi:hypothetical protein